MIELQVKSIKYNGYLRLSDSFEPKETNTGFEWTATVLNINSGYNEEILLKCKKLGEYCKFVEKVREYNKKSSELKDAINKAVNYCIKNDILRKFLTEHKAEVGEMILTEYNEEEHMAALKEYYEEQTAKAVEKAVKKTEKKAEKRINDAEERAKLAEAELKAYKQRFGSLKSE